MSESETKFLLKGLSQKVDHLNDLVNSLTLKISAYDQAIARIPGLEAKLSALSSAFAKLQSEKPSQNLQPQDQFPRVEDKQLEAILPPVKSSLLENLMGVAAQFDTDQMPQMGETESDSGLKSLKFKVYFSQELTDHQLKFEVHRSEDYFFFGFLRLASQNLTEAVARQACY